MIPFGVGDRVFVMPDPAPDLAWVGTVRAVSGDRATIELPPAPAGVAPLSAGGTVQLAIRQDGGIVLVAAEVVALGEREVELRAWTQEAPLGRSPRPVSRRHLRAELRTACEVALEGDVAVKAWLADLGAGGAEIVLPSGVSVAAGARGRCTLALPGEAPWTIDVRVVRVVREAGETRAGMAFEGLAPEIESRIDAFVHFVRRTRLTRRPPGA